MALDIHRVIVRQRGVQVEQRKSRGRQAVQDGRPLVAGQLRGKGKLLLAPTTLALPPHLEGPHHVGPLEAQEDEDALQQAKGQRHAQHAHLPQQVVGKPHKDQIENGGDWGWGEVRERQKGSRTQPASPMMNSGETP